MSEFSEKYPEASYFGDCPECGRNDGYLNIGRVHVMVCHAHHVRWDVGINLFSSWRDETEADWRRNSEQIARYRDVKALDRFVGTLAWKEANLVRQIDPGMASGWREDAIAEALFGTVTGFPEPIRCMVLADLCRELVRLTARAEESLAPDAAPAGDLPF